MPSSRLVRRWRTGSIPLQSAYCAAKHEMVGFIDSLRSELIHYGSHVRLTALHMPAMKTPQFSWCKSTMPRKAQPVPPIFQPDVCAEAVYWAAHQRHREVFVGWPTVQGIWGNRFLPGFLDHYLARMAWDGQMTAAPRDPNGPVDLYQPVPGHQSARGAFDDRSRSSSWEVRLTTRASWIAMLGSGLADLALRALTSRADTRSSSRPPADRAAQDAQGAPRVLRVDE